MVVQAFNSSTWEAEGGNSAEQVPGQPGLHRETQNKIEGKKVERENRFN